MTVTIYRSSDTSAPSLTGVAGSLVTLLDAILVNGYGSKSAAGWAKSFSGTNQATYRPGAGTQFYLHVNDAAPATAKEARLWGSEAATAVLTGTNLFPTVAQQASGLFARKSTTADSTTRSWLAAADERTVHLFALTADTAGCYLLWTFGDIAKLGTDGYNCLFVGRVTENSATTTIGVETIIRTEGNLTTASGGHYMPRAYTGIAGAIQVGKHTDYIKTGGAASLGLAATAGIQYLNGIDGGLYIAPLWIHETATQTIRGRVRGLWAWCHNVGVVNDGDTFSGTGTLAGRTFQVLKTSGGVGCYVLETSNTWDT